MRETTGRSRRVSTKLKAAFVALLAIFAVTAAGATSAQAADKLDITFNDGWIKIPALEAAGLEPIHALDPADPNSLEVTMTGDLDTAAGTFTSKASDFSFPSQSFEVTPGNNITLNISANADFTGNYVPSSGAFSANLPLKLVVDGPGFGVKCELKPLTIPLSSSGAAIDFGSVGDPPSPSNPKAGAPFAAPSNAGAVNGSWTNVTAANNVFGIPAYDKDAAEMTTDCKNLIGAFTGGDPNASFDGSLWLGGTSKVTHIDDPVCTPPQVGTPPNCENPVTPFAVSKVAVTPGKASVKAGKSVKLKVAVTNSGGTAGSATVALKSTNKKVTLPKSVKVSVAAGKTAIKTIVVKVNKKAKGKATITAKSGSKSGKSVLTIKKAKKK
ncbi:MAG TPA: hypothetical protein VMF31_13595 [Solirubrobacterales bacterium]|nr:hypothetical protein [Solirubrobacterales bacterium]